MLEISYRLQIKFYVGGEVRKFVRSVGWLIVLRETGKR
jgi:hypothetical protein